MNKPTGTAGDGIADDTAALQSWLNAGNGTIEDGTFRITAGLSLPPTSRGLRTHNATIIADTPEMVALTVTGAKSHISVHIDGNNKAAYGIKATSAGNVIEGCVIENIYSQTNTARAIEVTTSGGVTIRDNTIRAVNSVGDATGGNGPGFSRAIVLTSTTPATAKSLVTGNNIENIIGEEGDAIALLFNDGGPIFLPGLVRVAHNNIRNVSRRFIKVQASNCDVIGNTLDFDLLAAPAGGATALDVIQSEYINVEDNIINPTLIGGCISVVGTQTSPVRGVRVANNTTRVSDTRAQGHCYLVYTTDAVVSGNLMHGGSFGIAVGGSTKPLVQSNVHFGGINSEISFRVNSTNTGAVVRSNTNMNAARTTYIQNDGSGAVSELNLSAV